EGFSGRLRSDCARFARRFEVQEYASDRGKGVEASTARGTGVRANFHAIGTLTGLCSFQGGRQMAQGRIADRVAIVTGGASGIGKATVEVFAQEGAKVIIGDLPESEGEKIAKEIGGMFVATDVSDP